MAENDPILQTPPVERLEFYGDQYSESVLLHDGDRFLPVVARWSFEEDGWVEANFSVGPSPTDYAWINERAKSWLLLSNAGQAPQLKSEPDDVLPPIGAEVQIHLGSLNKWVTHTVVGYCAWPSHGGDATLQRVSVRVCDQNGVPNARLLRDVRRLDGTPYVVDKRAEAAEKLAKEVAGLTQDEFEHLVEPFLPDGRGAEFLSGMRDPNPDGHGYRVMADYAPSLHESLARWRAMLSRIAASAAQLRQEPAPDLSGVTSGYALVPTSRLKAVHRDLDACQSVIVYAGGFDPAYAKDARARLKEIEGWLSAAVEQGQDARETFQARVLPWMLQCFGQAIADDTQERNHRFLEEALELVQACGATASEAHQLVDYVFGRPIGEKHQEVGGVMVTLAALCLAQRLDMHQAGEDELARIWTMVEQIRAKQAAKPKHSPLPGYAEVLPSEATDLEQCQFCGRNVATACDVPPADVCGTALAAAKETPDN